MRSMCPAIQHNTAQTGAVPANDHLTLLFLRCWMPLFGERVDRPSVEQVCHKQCNAAVQ